MKIKISLLIAFLAFNFIGNAQIAFDKDTIDLIYVDMNNWDYTTKSKFTNNSTDPNDTVFVWVMRQELPLSWKSAVCDNALCYPDTTFSHSFEIGIGKSFEMKLIYYAEQVRDCGGGSVLAYSKLHPTTNRDSFYSSI